MFLWYSSSLATFIGTLLSVLVRTKRGSTGIRSPVAILSSWAWAIAFDSVVVKNSMSAPFSSGYIQRYSFHFGGFFIFLTVAHRKKYFHTRYCLSWPSHLCISIPSSPIFDTWNKHYSPCLFASDHVLRSIYLFHIDFLRQHGLVSTFQMFIFSDSDINVGP